MTVRRFYRSRLFWLGVPGLVFLLWAWWDSGGYLSDAGWERGRQEHLVWIGHGRVGWRGMRHAHGDMAGGFSSERMELQSTAGTRERRFDLPEALSWEIDDAGLSGVAKRKYLVRVALWVVVVVYVVVWLGAVVLWQRRKARAMKRVG